ncbi:TlpA family protein disulfide reductase [uncultured Fibrella sp.]|uniref:TlpA family protein disulfide reductase n=1 Tax=uncultured Fibrella sp. TaxID=1284596 RepID=UPI0035CAD2CE
MKNQSLVLLQSIIILCIISEFANGQSYDNISFAYPDSLKKNQIDFIYDPANTALSNSKTTNAIVYINELTNEEPHAVELKLEQRDKKWSGKIVLSQQAVSIMLVFSDTLNNVDNNEGKGYWVPMTENNKAKPGAFASIAYMYSGAWPSERYHISSQKNLAKRLFEEDFTQHSFIKRFYFRWYLSSLDKNNDTQLVTFKSELSEFSALSDLSEWDLLAISKFYRSINDESQAVKYNKLVFVKYPQGCWALQQASMGLQKEFFEAKSLYEKDKIYRKFKQKYNHYDDELTERYFDLRKGITMLSRLAPFYVENDQVEEWHKEVNGLSDDFKYPTLIYAAKSLNESGHAKEGELFAKQAVNWMQTYLDANHRIKTEHSFYTNSEIRKFREQRLTEYLGILGSSLQLQNKDSEAEIILKDAAITYGHSTDHNININYIEVLLKLKYIEKAIAYWTYLTENGKVELYAESQIHDLFSKYNIKLSVLPHSADKKFVFKNVNLINEHIEDFIFSQKNGKLISRSDYSNKIILIDFWATWCAPCIDGLNVMQKVFEKYKNDPDVIILTVNTMERNDELEKVDNTINKIVSTNNFTFPILFDRKNRAVSQAKVNALPARILIDKLGRLRSRSIGVRGTLDDQFQEISHLIEMVR